LVGLSFTVSIAFLSGFAGGLIGYSDEITPIETVHWSWSKFLSKLFVPSHRDLCGGLFAGLGIGLLIGQVAWREAGLGIGLLSFLSTGFSTVLVSGLGVGLGCGLILSIRIGLFIGLDVQPHVHLGGGMFYGLSIGLLYKLTIGIAAGLSGGEITEKNVPNEGIHRSARMAVSSGLGAALLVGLGAGLLVGLIVELAAAPPGSPIAGLPAWLGAGLLAGLLAGPFVGVPTGFRYGGRAFLQHLVLRLSLRYYDCIPRGYVAFLGYAAERLFLRRVGGGYIFKHRLLQDHFATMYLPERGDSLPQPSLPPL
jgi:hypothetical protein